MKHTASAARQQTHACTYAWKTKAELRAKYAALADCEALVDAEVAKAKSIPHPEDKNNQERRLYRILWSVEETDKGEYTQRTDASVSASADKEGTELVVGAIEDMQRCNSMITRGPTYNAANNS